MPAPETFTTTRLVARRISRADRPFLLEIWADPAVTATLGGPRDAERVDEILTRMTDHWDRCGFGTWILRDRATDAPVGWVGLHETNTGGPGGVELLYAISASRWREGLAAEAGRAAMGVAHDALGLDELVCFTLPDNLASQQTMLGLGFVHVGEAEHAGLPHFLTRVRLDQKEGAGHG